jgi:anti-anti-sigma factor
LANLVIKHDVRDSAVVVSVSGDIDTASVDTLVNNLETSVSAASDQSKKLLIVDLGEVTYFGSAGLNAVVGCYETAATNEVEVRVVANAAEVLRPLEVTQLDSVVRPYSTLQDALAGRSEDRG